MSGEGVAQNTGASTSDTTVEKGKGKAVDQNRDDAMEEDDSSSEESGAEQEPAEVEEPDEDNMEEIDTDNIIQDGRRTRGKTIDFAKAAEEAGDMDEDDDEDDDFEDEAMEQ
ncbi:hypothetical protein K490DRAFT_68866 [Saccharata proteae CBS 121410]|uniref:Histone chaperone domain-containing protein n=1 Tax=Saccharata proteae CBS 121410 TaxID=1314787 RepID=A0A9P4HPQ4_9PEZI|nr:hypothetical protein K490DRAFT_68866 [Saccharata proteae CBS 121410]